MKDDIFSRPLVILGQNCVELMSVNLPSPLPWPNCPRINICSVCFLTALVYRMRMTTVTKVACMHLLLDNGGNNRFIIDLTQNFVVGQKSRCLNFHKVSKRVRAEPKMDIKWLPCMGGRWLWPKYLTWLMTWHEILRLRWWIKLLNKIDTSFW